MSSFTISLSLSDTQLFRQPNQMNGLSGAGRFLSRSHCSLLSLFCSTACLLAASSVFSVNTARIRHKRKENKATAKTNCCREVQVKANVNTFITIFFLKVHRYLCSVVVAMIYNCALCAPHTKTNYKSQMYACCYLTDSTNKNWSQWLRLDVRQEDDGNGAEQDGEKARYHTDNNSSNSRKMRP